MGIRTGTGMSLPFIPQSHTSDQSLIGIERSGIWIWASDQWGEGAWRIRVSAAVSCHVKLVLGPVDDAQNPRQRPWCPVPVGTALVCLLFGLPCLCLCLCPGAADHTTPSPRPEKLLLQLHACFRDCPSISPLGHCFMLPSANLPPHK